MQRARSTGRSCSRLTDAIFRSNPVLRPYRAGGRRRCCARRSARSSCLSPSRGERYHARGCTAGGAAFEHAPTATATAIMTFCPRCKNPFEARPGCSGALSRARLLEAGDMISAARRMLVIASEDIGLAYPQCAAIVKACVDSAFQLGLPEARIPLAQAAIVMATAPKVQQCLHGDRRGARRHSRRQKAATSRRISRTRITAARRSSDADDLSVSAQLSESLGRTGLSPGGAFRREILRIRPE